MRTGAKENSIVLIFYRYDKKYFLKSIRTPIFSTFSISSYLYNLVFLLQGSLQTVFVCSLVYQLEDDHITNPVFLHLCSINQPSLTLHSFGLNSKFLRKGFSLAQLRISAHPLSNNLWPARQGHEINHVTLAHLHLLMNSFIKNIKVRACYLTETGYHIQNKIVNN